MENSVRDGIGLSNFKYKNIVKTMYSLNYIGSWRETDSNCQRQIKWQHLF